MNGAVYISFFQGQLESVLEQVVQLAVQEISKTVGSGLNTLLLETAVKEQENRRLRLQLQAWENRAKSGDGPADGTSSPAKSKSERPDGKSPERQQPQQQHGPGGAAGAPSGLPTDTRRREQRRRAVGRQLLYNTHTQTHNRSYTHMYLEAGEPWVQGPPTVLRKCGDSVTRRGSAEAWVMVFREEDHHHHNNNNDNNIWPPGPISAD